MNASFATLADVLGLDRAVEVTLRHGGTEIYVPRADYLEARPGHPLVREWGPVAARAMARAFGGTEIYVPRARPDVARALARRGCPERVIAERLGLRRPVVRRYLREEI